MEKIEKTILSLPWSSLILFCATIGLAPFAPPHVVEKLKMLFAGTLVKPIDIFDLLMHGTPWLVLILKALLHLRNKQKIS